MGGNAEKLAFFVCAVALLAAAVNGRPRYIECTDSLECGIGFCCSLGQGRFSLPRCLPLGEVNSVCSPKAHRPFNVTVSYPDGEVVELTNIHHLMCPCHPGLACSDRTGTCEDPYDSILENTID